MLNLLDLGEAAKELQVSIFTMSITRPSKDIVKVWIKCEYTDKGVTGMVEELGKKYQNIVETKALQEINCSLC